MTGAASRSGVVRPGGVDQEVRAIGWASVSGCMSGDIAAAPATTGVVSVCMTSSARVAGAGTPGSRGADTEVGTAGAAPSERSPWASSGPSERRR